MKKEQVRKLRHELHFDTGQLRAEAAEGGVRSIRGYPILFEVLGTPYMGSEWKEVIDKQALRDVDLSKLVLLLDHQTWAVLGANGKNMKAEIDDVGLYIDCTLGDTWMDDLVFDRVQRGLIDSMSFWFFADDWETDSAIKVDRVLHITKLPEVSLVAFPAYKEAVAIAREESENLRSENPEDEAAARKRAEAAVDLTLSLM